MTSHRFTIAFCAFLLLFAPAAIARPNVVFILIDDMGYGDLGCYGNTQVKTPNIDRFAAEGIRFTQFYVNSPICSPSRVAFTTGQYPQRHRITSFIASRKENQQRGMAHWLATTAPSLARMLQSSGYRTGHFGKWHMGGGRDVGEAPLVTEYGFDESLTQFEGLGDRLLCTFDTIFLNQPRNAHPLSVASAKLERGKIEFTKRADATGRFLDRSLEFIRAARVQGKPFYLNLWPDDVHSPHEPSPASRGDGSKQAMYHGVIHELDQQLGRLFDMIRNDAELKQNTLIILASDNGHDPIIHGAANLRGHKSNLYEAGIRVPLIVWWPGGQAKSSIGKTNDRSVIAGMDLPPTLLQITGAEPSADAKFDGIDMSSGFRGETIERTSPIFWARPPDRPGPDNAFPDLAARSGPWKLLIEEDTTRPELYDLVADPRETNNLAATHASTVQDLTRQLTQWLKATSP